MWMFFQLGLRSGKSQFHIKFLHSTLTFGIGIWFYQVFDRELVWISMCLFTAQKFSLAR